MAHLSPLICFNKELASIVLSNFGVMLEDSIWDLIISADVSSVKCLSKEWYTVQDGVIPNFTNTLSLENYSVELIDKIIEYLIKYLSTSKLESTSPNIISEICLSIPEYWFLKDMPKQGCLEYVKLFAKYLSDWNKELLSLLLVYGYQYKGHMVKYIYLEYETIARGYSEWVSIKDSYSYVDVEYNNAIELASRLSDFSNDKSISGTLLRSCGHVLRKREQYKESRHYYKKAHLLDKNDIRSYIASATSYLLERKFSKAISKCQKALEITKSEIAIYKTLLDIYSAKQDINMQIQVCLDISNNINDAKEEALKNIVELYLKQNDIQNATLYFNQYILTSPDVESFYQVLCSFCGAFSSLEKQKCICYDIIRDHADFAPSAYTVLAQISSKNDDFDNALELMDKAINLLPERILGYAVKSRLFEEKGLLDDALLVHESILNKFQSHAVSAHIFISRIKYLQNNVDEAIGSCKKAIELSTGSGYPYQELLNLYVKCKLFDEALSLCDVIMNEFNSLKIEISYIVGDIYRRKNDYKSAKKQFEDIKRKYPSDILGYKGCGLPRI